MALRNFIADLRRIVSGRSLRAKIIAWFFVPTAFILVAVAVFNFSAYQDVTEQLVVERDEELTRLTANQLGEELRGFTALLLEASRARALAEDMRLDQADALRAAASRLSVFDAGVVLLDNLGTVAAVQPARPDAIGEDWSGSEYFRELVGFRDPSWSTLPPDGPGDERVAAAAVPVIEEGGEVSGYLVGMFELGPSATSALYGTIVKLRIDASGGAYVVDREGRAIYHSTPERIGADFSGQAVVREVLSGENGAERTQDVEGRATVAGFAPIPGTPWGLVTEERWDVLTAGSRGHQRLLLFLLVLGAVLPMLLVAFGLRQLMRPIERLVGAARSVARGDFRQAIAPMSKDEIGALATEFNLMARQLEDSYANLEQRVADRTRELEESEGRLRTVVTGAPIVLFALDKNGVFTFSQGRGLEVLGLEPGEVVGGAVWEVYKDVPQILDDVRRALSGEEFVSTVDVAGITFETRYTCVRDDGQLVGLIGVATDITERIQAERALSEQTREVAVLEERNRMAREIHDTLAQGFTGIVLQLEAAEHAMGSATGEAVNHLVRARALARDSLQEARRSVWDLVPGTLERQSLESALEAEVSEFAAAGRERASFEIEGERRDLPTQVERALLRICQESLTNARRHAGASEVTVRLAFLSDAVRLEVRDNGAGFDPTAGEAADGPRGFGLLGMEQRTRALGGTLVISSAPGAGTVIAATIPTG